MQKILRSSIKLVIVLLITVLSLQAQAVVITSTVTGGQWYNSTTWVGGTIPGAGDDVIIVNGSAVSIGIDAECLSLTINTGNQSSSVTITAGADLTVHGDITINRTTLDGAF